MSPCVSHAWPDSKIWNASESLSRAVHHQVCLFLTLGLRALGLFLPGFDLFFCCRMKKTNENLAVSDKSLRGLRKAARSWKTKTRFRQLCCVQFFTCSLKDHGNMFESFVPELADGAQDKGGQVELVNITAGEIEQATGAGKCTGLPPILFVKNNLISSPNQHLCR